MISLHKNTSLFKSITKPYYRDSIFDYKLFNTETKRCNTITWLALTKEKAEYYKKKSKNATIYTYNTKKKSTYLITNYLTHLNIKSIKGLRVIFKHTLNSIPDDIKGKFAKYNYMNMTIKQRVDYEYRFAFGHMESNEQNNFLKLILKLQEYDLIPPTTKMQGANIFDNDKYMFKILRRNITLVGNFKQNILNQRFSLYAIDINIVNNLCKLYPNINGYVYLSKPSIWHKKMNDTSEIAVFNVKNIIK